MERDRGSRRRSRRDALRLAGAAGLAAAAGSAGLRQVTLAQTPPAGGDLSATKRTISLAAARQLIVAAEAKAQQIGVAMAIAIVDEGGLLKAFHRMDGVSSAATVDLVQMKAYSAASFRTPTHQIAEASKNDPARLASLASTPHFTLLAGGYPIKDGTAVVGGIGVGGGQPEQDMQVAGAALAALGH